MAGAAYLDGHACNAAERVAELETSSFNASRDLPEIILALYDRRDWRSTQGLN